VLKKRLHDYKWSGFRYYLGVAQTPGWLNRSFVLSSWGMTIDEKIRSYRDYVEKGLLSDNSQELAPNETSNIIGSDSFKEKIVRLCLRRKLKDIDAREQPELARINSFSVDDVIRCVEEYFNLQKTDSIVVRKGADLNARKIAMFLAVKHCKKNQSLAEIASYFSVGINAVSSNTGKCKKTIQNNKLLRKQVNKINEMLHENTKTKV
jgi:hypothetical protein